MRHLLGIFFSFLPWCAFGVPAQYRVAITQIVEHPSLDLTRKGVLDVLRESSLGKSLQVEYQNAQGNMITVNQIAAKILSNPPDAIVAIGTPSAQSVVNSKNKSTPVLFTPISDPVAAKLVKSLTSPSGLATGTTDKTSLEGQVQFIKAIVPKLKTLGVIYNPGEANSSANVKELKALTTKLGIALVEKTVTKSSDVPMAMSQFSSVEAVYVPTDNTVASAMEAAARGAIQLKKPLFVVEGDSVQKGALASLAISYYELGRMTGTMLLKVLAKQAKPEHLPVGQCKDLKVFWNQKTAQKLGLFLPDTLKPGATFF